jgi:hypothetical protein
MRLVAAELQRPEARMPNPWALFKTPEELSHPQFLLAWPRRA